MNLIRLIAGSNVFHGFLILVLSMPYFLAHLFFTKKEPSIKASGIAFIIAYVASILVYRWILNPWLR
jgi:hypothetical protein